MAALPATTPMDLAAPWGGRSATVDLDGPVHWVDFGGPEGDAGDAPPLVLVHGLGGSHLNWVQIGPELAEGRRVVALDLAGFGLTPGLGRDTSVQGNATMLGRFIEDVVGGGPVVLVGNSMGGMVSLLLASNRPELVAGLALISPAIPSARHRPDGTVALQFAVYATPVVGERVLAAFKQRYDERQRVLGTVKLCFAEARRADRGVIDAAVALTAFRDTQPGQEAAFLRAARSLLSVLARSGRYVALIQGIDKPVLLIHGDRDRLVPFAASQRLAAANPTWETEWLDGVGHTPQLEVPDRVLARLTLWLSSMPPNVTTGRAVASKE